MTNTRILKDEMVINVPKKIVWDIVSDANLLPRWHPFVKAITGEHRVGEVRVCELDMGGQKANAEERCNVREEETRISWILEKDTLGTHDMFAMEYGFELENRDNDRTLVRSVTSFAPRNEQAQRMVEHVEAQFHNIHQSVLKNLKQYVENTYEPKD